MKLNPNNPDNMITPMVSLGSLSKQIKGIKNALKQPELYNTEEIRHLKRALKDMYSDGYNVAQNGIQIHGIQVRYTASVVSHFDVK